MKRQLMMALGLAAAVLTFGSGCLVVQGDDGRSQGCYEDCYEYQVCETYCDAWECWDECWYETSCDVVCPEPVAQDPATGGADSCVCDIDCVTGDVCLDGQCVDKDDQSSNNGTAGLCQSCETTHDCGEPDARCIRLNYQHANKASEKVCSRICELDDDCPIGFECVNVSQEAGVPAQCLPKADETGHRTCTNDNTLECVKAKDCGVGESCVNNECVAPSGAECSADSDCAAGKSCLGSKCVEPDDSVECVDRGDCAAGEICIDGGCVAEEANSCIRNDECADGKCVDGQCADLCADDNECGAYERCRIPEGKTEGLCEEVECRRSADCAAGDICVDAVCEQACSADADCESGYVCNTGYCSPDPNVECRSNAECANDQICSDGTCANPCTCNQDCSAGQICNLNSGLCEDSGQMSGTQCANDCECPSGQTCQNNACVSG